MLNFEGCKSLRSFPSNLHFVCPVTINFSSCVNLKEFPQISGKITQLYLGQSAIEEVPSSIECLTDLEELDLTDCKRLKRISTRFCKLKSLVDLHLDDCLNLERFPEILEEMEHLKSIGLERTAITELPSSFENLLGLKSLSVRGCSKLDKLPDNIGYLKSLAYIFTEGSAISQLPSSVADSNIRSPLEELGASVLEKLSKYSHNPTGGNTLEISLRFTNCLKLNEKANNRILADSRLRIQHMIIALLRQLDERAKNKEDFELRACTIALPGSEIPDWLSNPSSGHLISIQLPSHSFCRNLIGFAFCAVVDFKQDLDCSDTIGDRCEFNSLKSPTMSVGYRFRLETKTVSEPKHVNRHNHCNYFHYPIDSDHVILGFCLCMNVGFPDGNNHTTVSFEFSPAVGDATYGGHGVKRCAVCPVYANPNETKANTFTLNFATEVGKLDDLPSASGTSNEEELEPSPKRICRADQINTP
ncbi:hypothetical protein CUMW_084800 [Citrus unshiu]|nr:hypothetical protein CUMW_084800 [Citrus unshiu]